MNARHPVFPYSAHRLCVAQRPAPITTQGGQLPEIDLHEIDEEPACADPARYRDQVAAHTHLATSVATWTALCVHGRTEVTWFRSLQTQADHKDCGCPESNLGRSRDDELSA
jgi:hypothetical protein